MKKQIKFKVFLVSNILLFLLAESTVCPQQKKENNLLAFFTIADSTNKDIHYSNKMYEQSKRLENINQEVDTLNKKWEEIEKKIKEQQNKPK